MRGRHGRLHGHDTIWVFGNVTYNVGRGIDVGDHPPSSAGTVNLLQQYDWGHILVLRRQRRDTSEKYGKLCQQPLHHQQRIIVQCYGITCNNLGNNLQQTRRKPTRIVPQSSTNTRRPRPYAYTPVATTNSTVGAGQNVTSFCSGNFAALCNDTTYATEITSNHTVVLRTTNAAGRHVGYWSLPIQPTGSRAESPNGSNGFSPVI